jgi:hypothetical protein
MVGTYTNGWRLQGKITKIRFYTMNTEKSNPVRFKQPKIRLLTSNTDLRRTGIFAWTLPANWVSLPGAEGIRFNVCPNAGVCASFCYAKTGTFMFSNVRTAHISKLLLVLNHREQWKNMMVRELSLPKYHGKYVRIHDAGDFFDRGYAMDWLYIMGTAPRVTFYAYTKEVALMKELTAQGHIPSNFTVIYSFGGKQDHMIDRDVDRHSDVFPDYDAMIAAGYNDIAEDDKQAAIHPNHRVGLYRNNIKHLITKQAGRTFGQWQREADDKLKQRNEHRTQETSNVGCS